MQPTAGYNLEKSLNHPSVILHSSFSCWSCKSRNYVSQTPVLTETPQFCSTNEMKLCEIWKLEERSKKYYSSSNITKQIDILGKKNFCNDFEVFPSESPA